MSIKQSLITPKTNCMACTACEKRCPTSAISMQRDEEGFLYPIVDYSLCIECNQCNNVCPTESIKPTRDSRTPIESYAAWNANQNELRKSSSGGIFSLLARRVFDLGGVVCGAVYDDRGHVYHSFAHHLDDLARMRGSKYVQSELRNCFNEVKDYLKKGVHVLFTGTPCQVGGLQAFLGKRFNDEHLLSVELICEGTPSPQLLENHIKDLCPDAKKINYLSFRDKVFGWGYVFYVKYETMSGESKEVLKKDYADYYNQALLSFTSLRPACYKCSFKDGRSGADICIGDFWALQLVRPELKASLGANAINVFTSKGREAIQEISSGLACFDSIPHLPTTLKNGTYYTSAAIIPEVRSAFYANFQSGMQLAENLESVKHLRRSTAIFNDYSASDLGAKLASYGFAYHMRLQGYPSCICTEREECYINRELHNPHELFEDTLLGVVADIRGPQHSIPIAEYTTTFISEGACLDPIPHKAQSHFPECGLLEFVPQGKSRIIYAGSLGDFEYESPLASGERARRAFCDIDSFSVRSKAAQLYIKKQFQLDVDLVVSPIFLRSKKDWQRLSHASQLTYQKPYTALQLHNITQKRQDALIDACVDHNYILLQDNDLTIIDWLARLENSQLVITSSYNTLCFALQLERPFVWVSTPELPNKDGLDLLQRLGLESRILHLHEQTKHQLMEQLSLINDSPLCYSSIEKQMTPYIEESKAWLLRALREEPKHKDYVLNNNQQELQREKKAWRQEIKRLLLTRLKQASKLALHGSKGTIPVLRQAKAYWNLYTKGHPHA